MSKCGETYIDFYKLYDEYDNFLSGGESNSPWVSEVSSKFSFYSTDNLFFNPNGGGGLIVIFRWLFLH